MFAPIVAHGIGPTLASLPVVVAHVLHHASVSQLIDCTLIATGLFNNTTQFPVLTPIIRIDQLRTIGLRTQQAVVGRHDHSSPMRTVQQLNAMARSCCIPAPVVAFYIGCNLLGLRPASTIILGVQDKHPTGILGCALHDLPFRIFTQIPAGHQHDASACAIHNRSWITADIGTIIPNH